MDNSIEESLLDDDRLKQYLLLVLLNNKKITASTYNKCLNKVKKKEVVNNEC